MEYIQCPHCLKKYGVNEKIRAASGKTIRCKGCQETFEIAIYATPEPEKPAVQEDEPRQNPESSAAKTDRPEATASEAATTDTASEQKPAKEKADKKTKPAKKRSFQMLFTIVLALLLLIAVTVALIFQFKPDLLEPVSTEQTQLNEPEKIAVVEPKAPTVTVEKAPQGEVTKEVAEEKPGEKPEAKAETTASRTSSQDPVNASGDCKRAAVEQWFTDYMMMHGDLSSKEYIRLLDESSSHTERVRTLCGDKHLASRITEAAKLGEKPGWIEAEISDRTSSKYEGSTQKSRW